MSGHEVTDPRGAHAPGADAQSADPVLGFARRDIEALQLERLQQTLRHAYANNPCYRRSFDAHGVRPDDLRTLQDLARFPFTTKADLRAAYPFGFFSVPMDQVARVHASSGTTGKPTVVGYTRKDIDTWSHLVARSIRAAGGRRGMRVHVAYGYGLFTGGLGAHYGAEAAGCTVIPMSGGQTERQVQLIMDFRPDIIMITPSYMLALLDEFRRQGIDPASSGLSIGIFGAEPWGEGIRQEIESAFRIDACDIYGLSEVMGPGVAQEFARTAMRRFAKITGRTDDMLIIRGVNLFPSQVEELILERPGLAPHYELEVSRPHRMDELVVTVEARPDLPAAARASEARALGHSLKSMVGISAEIRVVSSGSLQRSGGKAVRVTDRR